MLLAGAWIKRHLFGLRRRARWAPLRYRRPLAVELLEDRVCPSVPMVTGVAPSAGPGAGGTQVAISGTNLAAATAVKFGSSSASITSDSDTQIIALSPPGTGTVDVTVTTAGGASAAVAGDQFTYLQTPTAASPSGAIVTARPTFAWNPVAGADHYDVWVDDTTSLQSQILRNTNVTSTSWTPTTALTPGHSYRWWVRALSTSGGSSAWSAPLTVSIVVGTPNPAAPTGSIQNARPTFSWSAAANADAYDVWVDDTTSGQSQVLRNTNVTATSWTPTTALTPGHAYLWWVRGLTNSGASSSWSSPTAFNVALLPTPVLVGPTGGSTQLSVTFTWNAVASATHYYLWVQDAASGAIVVQNQNITSPSYGPTAFTVGHSYDWWVRAFNDASVYSAWSAPLVFSIQPPPAPKLSSPSGTIQMVNPTFQWQQVASADSYEIWINDNTAQQAPLYDVKNITATTWTPPNPLVWGHGYTWWVRALRNDGNNSAWSGAVNFTPVLGTPTPVAPSGPLPATVTIPTFSWTAVANADAYDILVDDMTTQTPQVLRNTHVVGTSWTPSTALTIGHAYQWQVRAVTDNGGAGPFSSRLSFNVPALDGVYQGAYVGTVHSTGIHVAGQVVFTVSRNLLRSFTVTQTVPVLTDSVPFVVGNVGPGQVNASAPLAFQLTAGATMDFLGGMSLNLTTGVATASGTWTGTGNGNFIGPWDGTWSATRIIV
jgi:hypothetical protein